MSVSANIHLLPKLAAYRLYIHEQCMITHAILSKSPNNTPCSLIPGSAKKKVRHVKHKIEDPHLPSPQYPMLVVARVFRALRKKSPLMLFICGLLGVPTLDIGGRGASFEVKFISDGLFFRRPRTQILGVGGHVSAKHLDASTSWRHLHEGCGGACWEGLLGLMHKGLHGYGDGGACIKCQKGYGDRLPKRVPRQGVIGTCA